MEQKERMASAVQHSQLSLLPGLGSLKSRDNNCDAYGENSVGDPIPDVQTPTSSADPASERIDPVLLLSRPVEGFNHPRQHLFTDRLLGRFYEDSSLDAETRKTSKCLAGRLGTAGSNTNTRPGTTATTASHLRSSHSPTTIRRGGKRMHGSASARAVGREPGGAGLAGRKEQVQKEILEQKALIERLEGRVASLSGRGARNAASRGSSAPSKEDREREASRHRQCRTDDRPAMTPEPESMEVEQGSGVMEVLGDGHCSAEQVSNHSPEHVRVMLENSDVAGSQPHVHCDTGSLPLLQWLCASHFVPDTHVHVGILMDGLMVPEELHRTHFRCGAPYMWLRGQRI